MFKVTISALARLSAPDAKVPRGLMMCGTRDLQALRPRALIAPLQPNKPRCGIAKDERCAGPGRDHISPETNEVFFGSSMQYQSVKNQIVMPKIRCCQSCITDLEAFDLGKCCVGNTSRAGIALQLCIHQLISSLAYTATFLIQLHRLCAQTLCTDSVHHDCSAQHCAYTDCCGLGFKLIK